MVEKGRPCEIEFVVFIEDGVEIESNVGQKPLTFIPGENHLFPKLEMILVGKNLGDEVTITLAPEDTYGPVDEEAFQVIPTSALPEDMKKEGAILGLQDQNKPEEVFQARVHSIRAEETILDLNHPLAGRTLTFKMKILSC